MSVGVHDRTEASALATLDYALLAEYARIDGAGLLTVVGGSFDRIQAAGPGAAQQMSVALRILLEADETSADFEVQIRPPDDQFRLGFTGNSEKGEVAQILDGKVAVVVVTNMVVPLPVPGVYHVTVTVGGESKRIPFAVDLPPAAADAVG